MEESLIIIEARLKKVGKFLVGGSDSTSGFNAAEDVGRSVVRSELYVEYLVFLPNAKFIGGWPG